MSKRTWVAGKPKKKPNLNLNTVSEELLQTVSMLYEEKDSEGKPPSLKSMVDELTDLGYGILNPIKVRKLLITAGVYESEIGTQVLMLYEKGKTVEEIGVLLQLSRASVHSYLPYEKIIYKLDQVPEGDISVGAERQRLYKERQQVVKQLQTEASETMLWNAVLLFAGYPFQTSTGLKFTYTIKIKHNGEPGNELVITRREKTITKATVLMAYRKVLELDGKVSGPKKLGVFGASYLYPIFKRFELI